MYFATAFRYIRHEAVLIYDNHYSLAESRNRVVLSALKNSCDQLFLIDTDIIAYRCDSGKCSIFYDVFNYMLENYKDYPVIGVYHYSKRGHPNVYRAEWSEDLYHTVLTPIKLDKGVHKVDAQGIGILLVSPKVLQDVGYPYFRVLSDYKNGTLFEVGEDVYFFYRLHEKGIPSYCTADIVALHSGEYFLDHLGRVHISIPFEFNV
jgi:GT2 family glycosyltransferase